MVLSLNILHPRLYVVRITYVQDIPKTVCNSIQAKKSILRHPIFLTDADYDCKLDEIKLQYKIDFESNVSGNS